MDQAPASTANHALEACERMLRPIMRLALDRGLKYQDIDELIRSLMLDEAAREWAKRNGKEPSGSQLSVTTGINRKEVKKRTVNAGPRLTESGKSIAEQAFRKWNYELQATPEYSELIVDSENPEQFSFAKLVKQLGGDVHFRSVLDELVRLKLVSEAAGKARLEALSFVPPGVSPQLLAVVADNANAHLSAAVSNISEADNRYLERAIWGEGMSLNDCEEIHALARKTWEDSRVQLYRAISAAPGVSEPGPKYQIRVGTYAYVAESN